VSAAFNLDQYDLGEYDRRRLLLVISGRNVDEIIRVLANNSAASIVSGIWEGEAPAEPFIILQFVKLGQIRAAIHWDSYNFFSDHPR